ncbi:hypothetical protein MCHI_001364 [Candidatus Magnetoovum chiemensis]|nr:hypothetical protein MCHI_001364 [Candidatus Magnetoovum chiemensis]
MFYDAKRVFTKEKLMRIDLARLAKKIDFQWLVQNIPKQIASAVKEDAWTAFLEGITRKTNQLILNF